MPQNVIRDFNRHGRNRFSKLPFYRFSAILQRPHRLLHEVSDKERFRRDFLPNYGY
jgi:hypothetical protein